MKSKMAIDRGIIGCKKTVRKQRRWSCWGADTGEGVKGRCWSRWSTGAARRGSPGLKKEVDTLLERHRSGSETRVRVVLVEGKDGHREGNDPSQPRWQSRERRSNGSYGGRRLCRRETDQR